MSRIEEALRQYGHPAPGGRWWFSDPYSTHSEASALAITAACLTLDVPVTDVLTGRSWFALVDRVTALEERLKRIESGP